MFKKKDSEFKQWREMTLVFLALFAIDQFFAFDLTFWRAYLLFGASLFFALRYGWRFGAGGFGFTVVYQLAFAVLNQRDLLLLIYDADQVRWLLTTLIVPGVSGFFVTSAQEETNDLQSEHRELQTEHLRLIQTAERLEQSREHLLKKVMEFENTPAALYSMMKSIDGQTPEQTLAGLADTTAAYFQTTGVNVYMREFKTNTFSLLLGHPSARTFSITESSSFCQRLMSQKKVITRSHEDEKEAPLLGGVLVIEDEVIGVVTVDEPDFERLTSYDMDVLQQLLLWTADCLEKNEGTISLLNGERSTVLSR